MKKLLAVLLITTITKPVTITPYTPQATINLYTQNLNQCGLLDQTFGAGGKVITSFGGTNDLGYAIALQQDGKLVAAGTANANGGNYDFALVRYNTNGTLDVTFGANGKVITSFISSPTIPSSDRAYAVAIQQDGKIVAAG